jgi:8-oxo-dGTP pyrophosphatase MutT (NUDIX family)
MTTGKVKPWEQVSTKKVGDFRVFTIRSDLKVSPRTGQEHDFYVIESVNWVNVLALTREGKLVMIEQYRHGSNTVELEIPGGMMDADDSSPLEAGLRELREETGYEGSRAEVIGQIFANPAIMSNICYTVLVQDCELKHAIELDGGEDLATLLVEPKDIPDLMRSGRIGHSLVAVALYHFELWRQSGGKSDEPQSSQKKTR